MKASEMNQAYEVYQSLGQLNDDQLQCICENLVYNNPMMADLIQQALTNYFQERLDNQYEQA